MGKHTASIIFCCQRYGLEMGKHTASSFFAATTCTSLLPLSSLAAFLCCQNFLIPIFLITTAELLDTA